MNKFIITIIFTFLLLENVSGKIVSEAVQENIGTFKKNLTKAIDKLVVGPVHEETLKKIEGMLPVGPKGVWSGVEKDIFSPDIDKNKAAIEILEKKIKLFSEAIKELNKFLELQKSIQKKWDIFFKTRE